MPRRRGLHLQPRYRPYLLLLALTWARAGFTVDPDSVRAEEWVNSFDYGYAGPGDDDSFAITSDVVEHPLNRDWHLARVALQRRICATTFP